MFADSLRVVQHVETIRVPTSWESLESKTWKDVTWDEKQFEVHILVVPKYIGLSCCVGLSFLMTVFQYNFVLE